MKRIRANTLTEVLIVVAVIATIAAMIVPVLTSAKKKGSEATALNNLHQLGLAAGLYHNDFGEYPVSIDQLVAQGMATKELASSPFDTKPDGWANDFAKRAPRSAMARPLKYRVTFVSVSNFGYGTDLLRKLEEKESGGWLVDPTIGTCADPLISWCWHGPYIRLSFDGAAIRRTEPWTTKSYRGRPSENISFKSLFGDDDKS